MDAGGRGEEMGRAPFVWVLGYGNPQRRDDGIGPFVIRRLRKILGGEEGVRTVALQQLGPELVEDLEGVENLVLVDASTEAPAQGVLWEEVKPSLGAVHPFTHHVSPAYLLGLTKAVYGRHPRTWTVSVLGEDFDLGEGLSGRAEERAVCAISELLEFIRDLGRERSIGETVFPCAGEGN